MPFDPLLAATRYGYGLPVPTGAPDSVAAILAALHDPDHARTRWPIPDAAEVSGLVDAFVAARRQRGRDPAADEAFKDALRAMTAPSLTAAKARFARALANPDGFRERLAAFWANHFTAAPRDGTNRFLPFAMMDQAIRPNLTATFADLLTAVTLHPAMLIYLDQTQSIGPTSPAGRRSGRGLNENLAREVLELHTLGVGAGYTQADVRQMAELLTGLATGPDRSTVFDPRRVEPGSNTVLGKTYEGADLAPIRAVLTDLARRPETARHIARKLAVHFVADVPDPALIAALETAWSVSSGDLPTVYAALLTHPAAWQPRADKARQPLDFLIAALRALDVPADDVATMTNAALRRMLLDPLARMNQPLNLAPGPDGWAEEAAAWITPQGLAARITWAMEVPARLKTPLPDPTALARRGLGPRAGDALLWAAARAENRREGVGLVLASPEFNRR